VDRQPDGFADAGVRPITGPRKLGAEAQDCNRIRE
jgi:hypothetical protein